MKSTDSSVLCECHTSIFWRVPLTTSWKQLQRRFGCGKFQIYSNSFYLLHSCTCMLSTFCKCDLDRSCSNSGEQGNSHLMQKNSVQKPWDLIGILYPERSCNLYQQSWQHAKHNVDFWVQTWSIWRHPAPLLLDLMHPFSGNLTYFSKSPTIHVIEHKNTKHTNTTDCYTPIAMFSHSHPP